MNTLESCKRISVSFEVGNKTDPSAFMDALNLALLEGSPIEFKSSPVSAIMNIDLIDESERHHLEYAETCINEATHLLAKGLAMKKAITQSILPNLEYVDIVINSEFCNNVIELMGEHQ